MMSLKGSFDKPINVQKRAFGNQINNDYYLHKNKVLLEINERLNVRKYEMAKIII